MTEALPEDQAGFRRNRCCEDNLFVLYAKISLALCNPKGKLYVLFVDFRRAFDSVNHQILWNKLYATGVSSQFVRVLQDLYCKATMRVRSGCEESKELSVTRGVLQGDCLSPLLFTLLVSDIIDFFRTKGFVGVSQRMEILLFADDLVKLRQIIL